MTDDQKYARFAAGDRRWDGRFFVGVRTTGIYCLPSCKAKKARRENVRFFPSCSGARAAGFRACRKCHPEDFAAGRDPEREAVRALIAEIAAEPGRFSGVGSVVKRSGFGATRLFELFRRHGRTTPARALARARLEAARRRLLAGRESLADVAAEAGYRSLSSFHAHFRRRHGLTPAAYRRRHAPAQS